jgi:hypothetical protein
MKNRNLWFAAVAVFLFAAISTNAQGKFEVTPFVGYETGGSYPVNVFSTTELVDRLRVNDALAYGTFLDFNLSENGQLEFMWNRNSTSYSARDFVTSTYHKAYNSDIDQFQFGGLYMLRGSEHALRPYIAGSLGFTHDSNSALNGSTGITSDRTEFSFSVGGGVKYYVSRHIGFRGDVRYLPTYGSSSYGTYCDPFYGCYSAKIAHYLNRGSFVGGVIFKF